MSDEFTTIATLQEQLAHQRDRNRVLRELLTKAETDAELVQRAREYPWWGEFREYVLHLLAKLERGHWEYGDKSWHRSMADLLGEQMQEALDLDGWGFLLWSVCREKRRREDIA